MGMTNKLPEVFFDIQSDLPRQGPGESDSTRRALALCKSLASAPRILDIGCGPGAQTLVLAEQLHDASITGIDVHQPYLEELRARAAAAGVSDRVVPMNMPMEEMTFAPETFDLIWAEGSAYIMGFSKAVADWRRLLKRRGYLAVTELVWLTEDKPVEAAEFFMQEYPAMMDRAGVAENIRVGGYELIANFTLPDSAWWEPYYTPLLARLPALETEYAGDAASSEMIANARREVEVRRRFTSSYGYEFFVARKID
jgi:ubiquinone/menaquinone biosynthesis C-methylase UbiE